MGRYLILLFLILIGCIDNTEEDMKLFSNNIHNKVSATGLTTEENIIIIGTSNGRNRGEAIPTNAMFPDLPVDGVIADAYFADGTAVLKPYQLYMNNVGTNTSQNYGYEYRIAKNLIGTKTQRVNLLKVGIGSSALVNNWALGGSGTLGTISIANATSKTWNKCLVIGWENDCIDQARAEAIEVNFNALIAKLRAEISADMEFWVLEQGPFTSGTTPYLTIGKTQIQNVADADAKVHMFVPTWLSPDSANFIDGIHYDIETTNLIALEFIKQLP